MLLVKTELMKNADNYPRAMMVEEVCMVNIRHFIIITLDKFMIKGSTWTLAAGGDLKPSQEFLK